MKNKVKNAIWASFTADALSLGVHWVYDTDQIKEKYGRLEHMVRPELVAYHENKNKGEFTHYGDQMMVLLESVVDAPPFHITDFGSKWQRLFDNYKGYMDHATVQTLENRKLGKPFEEAGSASYDLSGAARIPPLLLGCCDDLDGLVRAAKQQTAMTHNQHEVIQAAEWAVRTAVCILKGDKPSEAMFKSLEDMPDSQSLFQMVDAGYASREKNTLEAITGFGQMCSMNAALPSAVHLASKYEERYKDAMIENIMAGGDSSARGILAGCFIGCYMNDATPSQWLEDLYDYKRIEVLLSKL